MNGSIVSARNDAHNKRTILSEREQQILLKSANGDEESSFPPTFWSLRCVRMQIAILLAAALCVEGLMRSNLSMAMVCMVNRTALAQLSSANSNREVLSLDSSAGTGQILANTTNPCLSMTNSSERGYDGEFVWTTEQQGWIFTAFYCGGLFIVIPGSYLCDWFGPALVVQYGSVINIIGTFLTPTISRYGGVYPIILIRFIMGCGQGVLVPCTSVLIVHWFPPSEKSTAVAFSSTGNQLSVIIAMYFTAQLCQIPILDGWPLAFYTYGLIGIVFCFAWQVFVNDVPTRSKKISDAELTHITGTSKCRGDKRAKPKVPWKKILASAAIWSCGMCSFAQSFVLVGTITYLPLYYRTILGMDLTSNGILSAAPFIVQFVMKVIFAALADESKRCGFSVDSVTKFCNLFASVGTAICYILLAFFDCTHRLFAVVLIITSMGFVSGFIPGHLTSIVSIAPKYTASVAAFCRLWGTIGSVASPYLIGVLVKKSVLAEWQIVFSTMAIVLTITGITFQIFGSGKELSWVSGTSSTLVKDDIEVPLATIDEFMGSTIDLSLDVVT